jgi:hypothetical protein
MNFRLQGGLAMGFKRGKAGFFISYKWCCGLMFEGKIFLLGTDYYHTFAFLYFGQIHFDVGNHA